MVGAGFWCFFLGYSTTFRQNRRSFPEMPGSTAAINTGGKKHSLQGRNKAEQNCRCTQDVPHIKRNVPTKSGRFFWESHAADKKGNSTNLSGGVSFLCRWWGSNPHVLLAQGILSFYPHLPSGVIQWYLVISGSHCAKAKFTPQRTIIWNIHDFSMRFSSTLFFRFGPPKWKLEGCSGGMQGKTLLCLGTKRKESQG